MIDPNASSSRRPRLPWIALRRLGEPEDIADIVAFLASDEARWLTGATLPANGGLVTTAANILARAQR